jgi:hypothetical protein
MDESQIQASVGMSRKWNAKDAGREVAETALKKLDSSPSFILLYSTINYEKHGGFQELLDGVREILPKNTPLIGGTITGFINNYGCYARGVTALAVSCPNIDLAMGIGKHTKSFPKTAARKCAYMIQRTLNKSKYKNKFLINSISGPTIPMIPFFGRLNIVKSKFIGNMLSHIGMPLTGLLGYGIGKEGDIVDELGKKMKDYYIIGGSTMDDGKQLACYQFYNDKVYENTIVAIGGAINQPISLNGTVHIHGHEKNFKITKTTFGKRIIKKIENQPAKKRYHEIMDIPDVLYTELEPFYYKTTNYFPISFKDKREYVSGVGAFLGDNLLLGYKARNNDAIILSVGGKETLEAVDIVYKDVNKDTTPFSFINASGIRFMTMIENGAFKVKDKLDYILGDTPYILVGTVNENMGTPDKKAVSRVYSFNAFSIKKDNENFFEFSS